MDLLHSTGRGALAVAVLLLGMLAIGGPTSHAAVAVTHVVPNGDRSNLNFYRRLASSCGESNAFTRWTAVDEPWDSPNDTACGSFAADEVHTRVADSPTVSKLVAFNLTDSPANLLEVTQVHIDVRARRTSGLGSATVVARLKKPDGTTVHTATMSVGTFYSTYTSPLGAASMTKAEIDGAYVEIDPSHTSSNEIKVSLVNVQLNYTTTTANTAPNAPTALQQLGSAGAIPAATWTRAGTATSVRLRFDISDPDLNQGLRPWVEVVPVETGFSATCGSSVAGQTFSAGVIETGTAESTHTATVYVSGLTSGTRYAWRACAVDGDGTPSPWTAMGSAPFDFAVDDVAPPTAVATSPADGAALASTPALVATYADTAPGSPGGLSFELCSDSSCTSVLESGSSATNLAATGESGTWTPAALPAGTYHWRVAAVDGAGSAGGWSAARSFSISANAAPAAPASLSQRRADGVTTIAAGAWTSDGASSPVRLRFQSSDADGGQLVTPWVEVVASGAPFAQACGATSATTYQGTAVAAAGTGVPVQFDVPVSGLASGQGWRWRACVVDAAGAASAWTASGGAPDFRVDSAAPAIALAAPAPTSTTTNTTPALSASYDDADPGSTGTLEFRIGTSTTCGTSVVQSGASAGGLADGATGSWTAAPLAAGTYHWCARAVDQADNTSSWTPTRQLRIGTPTLTLSLSTASISRVLAGLGSDEVVDALATVTTDSAGGYSLHAVDASDTLSFTCSCGAGVPDWTGPGTAPTAWPAGSGSYGGITVLDATGGRLPKWGSGTATSASDFVANRYAGLAQGTSTTLHGSSQPVASDTVRLSWRFLIGTGAAAGTYSQSTTITALALP